MLPFINLFTDCLIIDKMEWPDVRFSCACECNFFILCNEIRCNPPGTHDTSGDLSKKKMHGDKMNNGRRRFNLDLVQFLMSSALGTLY